MKITIKPPVEGIFLQLSPSIEQASPSNALSVQDGTRVSLLVDQRLNAAGIPAENGTLKVPDATWQRSDLIAGANRRWAQSPLRSRVN